MLLKRRLPVTAELTFYSILALIPVALASACWLAGGPIVPLTAVFA